MHRTPNPQPRIAGPSRKGPAHKRKDERGMALVFALMGILILSMLAAALLVVTNADALASFNYKNQIQASYTALAGVHRTVDWFRGTYSPWLNPTTGGTPDAATDPPVTASEYGGTPNAPTYTGAGGAIVLGDSANFPTVASNTISSNFNTMRNSLNTISLGDATGDFAIRDVTLLSHDRYKAFDGVTDRIVERWRLRVQGRVRNAVGTELAVVEETAVLQMGPLPIFGNALHGQCSLEMNGALITDSFDSSNGLYGGSNLFTGEDAGASVASNSFTGSSGSSGVINGNLYGTVKFSGSVADLADETRHAELPWISIPTRHYQPRRLAVSPLRCELSRCRRSPGPTRHYGVLRSDPAVVPHVRFSIRSPVQASTGPAGRHLAPGRGLRHHPGTAALSLACRRSRW